MKLIIAGSRTIDPTTTDIDTYIALSGFIPDEIVSGGANGVDDAAKRYAMDVSMPFKLFPADWPQYGKSAGPIRNQSMAEYADALLLIWDGMSRGSRNMKSQMKFLDKPIYEVIL